MVFYHGQNGETEFYRASQIGQEDGQSNVTTAIECRVCKGKGKQHLIVHSADDQGAKNLDVNCVWCDGTGAMSAQSLKEYEWNQTAWCKCEDRHIQWLFFDDSVPHYLEYEGEAMLYEYCPIDKHHYHCSKCGKITQIG